MTTSILYARALYDYDDASNANVLSLKEGDVITITEVREDGWWAGKLGEKVGYFPSNYVEVVPEPNSTSDSTASTTSAQPPSRGNIPVLPVKASAPTPLHTDGVHVEMQTFGRTPKPSKMSKISTQFSQEKKELADEPRGGHRSTSTESESTWISSPLTTAGAASTLALPGGGAVSPIAGEGRGRNHSRHAFGETSESTVYNNLSPKTNGKTSIVVGEAGAAVVDDEGKQKESWWTRDKKPRFTWIPCRRKGFVLSRAQYYALCCFFCGLFTMVFFLILIYAVMPAIIKSAVAGAQLQFTSITITNPQSNSLDLNANGLITNAGPFKAALDQMTMYVSEINADGTRNLLGTITLQPITIEGDTSISTQTQFAVLDQNAFNNFTRHLIFNNQVMWHLEASATVTPMLGSVKGPSFSNIPFSKDITLTACGGLLDVQLNTFNLSRSTPTDIIVDLAVMINNPSIFNIHPLGDLHFQMVYNGTKLGDVFATAASLSAGENILPMSGYLKPADPAVAGAVVNRYLTGSQTSVVAVADPVDGSSIPLYNLGMRGLSLNTVLNPYQGSLIGGMEFSALSLTPSANSLAVTFGGNLTMNIISPLGSNSPLIIQTMSMEANMTYAGQVIGALSIPTIPVAGVFPVQNGYKLNLTLTFAVDLVANMALFGDGTNYVNFVKTFLAANMLQIGISGKANTAVTYALGPLVVTGLPVVTTSNLAGLQNLNQTTVQSINVLGNRAGCGQTNCGLSVSIQASIFNPSVATVSLGPSSMWLNYSNAIVGQATSSNLVLAPGANHLTLSGYINPSDPNNLPVIEQFLSNYLNGIPCLTYLQSALGTPLSNGLYADAKSLTLSALTLSTAVVQAPVQLLQAINIGAFQLGFQSNQALPITATSSVSVTMAMPSNLAAMPITVLTTSMAMTINAVINGVSMPMASLQIPVTGVTQTGTSPSYTLSLSFAALSMSIAAPGYAFSNFTELTVTQQSVQVEIFGTASATAQTGLGAITLTGIPAHSFVTIPALHNFFTPSSTTPTTFMTISSLDITSGDANGMYMNAAVTVNNPSSVVTLTNAGQVQLDMVFNPSTGVYVKLADVTVSNFQLTSTTSPTVLSATATLKEGSNPTATRLFLSNYMQQISQTPLILGSNTDFNGNPVYRAGTVQQYLVGAINALNSAAVLPGLGSVLIAHIYMLLTASSKACLNNPFSADIQITGFTNGVISINGGTLGGNQLATLNEQITFLLPAHSTNFISPTLSASLALTGIGSLSSLDMDVQLACKIGGANGYPTVVHIVQTAIPATLDIFSLPSTC